MLKDNRAGSFNFIPREQRSGHSSSEESFILVESLLCVDFIFALLNHSFNKTEPIVLGFKNESKSLNTDINMRSSSERMEVLGRAYIAKEMTIELEQELENKLHFIMQM